MRVFLLLLFVTPLSLAGCGDEFDDAEDSRQPDPSLRPDAYWDPGEDAPDACTYGYGEACPEAVVDCDDDPCVHGACVRSETGTAADFCTCDRGYAGERCDACAPSYEPDGLTCVFRDPCAGGPCVFGTCRIDEDAAYCDCFVGYAGELCDTCADGYRVEGLECVPE